VAEGKTVGATVGDGTAPHPGRQTPARKAAAAMWILGLIFMDPHFGRNNSITRHLFGNYPSSSASGMKAGCLDYSNKILTQNTGRIAIPYPRCLERGDFG
jgi:hypothetical protein